DVFGAEVGSAAGPELDNDGLTENILKLVRERARGDVGRPARRIRNDDPDGPAGIVGLGGGGRRQHQGADEKKQTSHGSSLPFSVQDRNASSCLSVLLVSVCGPYARGAHTLEENQSTFAPDAFTIGPHLVSCSRRNARVSSTVAGNGIVPETSSLLPTSDRSAALRNAALSFSTIGCGMPFGPTMPKK